MYQPSATHRAAGLVLLAVACLVKRNFHGQPFKSHFYSVLWTCEVNRYLWIKDPSSTRSFPAPVWAYRAKVPCHFPPVNWLGTDSGLNGWTCKQKVNVFIFYRFSTLTDKRLNSIIHSHTLTVACTPHVWCEFQVTLFLILMSNSYLFVTQSRLSVSFTCKHYIMDHVVFKSYCTDYN